LRSTDSLQDREIVLAGGSGGIGSAVAGQLLADGARLVISYLGNRERAERWRKSSVVMQADLISSVDRARVLDSAPGLYGVVILAGNPARVSDPAQLEPAMMRSHAANYLGPILFAREAAVRMRSSGTPGAIVLVSTMQANALFPGSTTYGAQKAALQHAALILARESRGAANVRVNVVRPGVIAAGMAEASIAAGKYDQFIEKDVIGRFGYARDVARAVRFFLEPDNYITGQVLCVDGGITL
jgi:3-oxoacyl-[acyl-carrier protein] reductase